MPLTDFQRDLAIILAKVSEDEAYLAGGAALHLQPNSLRYSNDLDYFCDSEQRVATAFQTDRNLLEQLGYKVQVEISIPGYVRCIVAKNMQTKVEWAHDSAWRFLPLVNHNEIGFTLHPIDLAINKILALAGRDEPRDFLDTIYIHDHILSLGALCWAACGKDPGFTPQSILSLIKRRGKYHPEDFIRLHLVGPVDLPKMKEQWMSALEQAAELFTFLPPEESGCLYWDNMKNEFVTPDKSRKHIVPHFGRPRGVLPRIIE